MEEQLISYETAKLAKEKGFDWLCPFYYRNKDSSEKSNVMNQNTRIADSCCSAPTQSLLQKWLRDKHHRNVFPKKVAIGFGWHWLIEDMNGLHLKGQTVKDLGKDKFEDALEIGLIEALNLIEIPTQGN